MNKQRVINFLTDIEWLFGIQNFDRKLTFKNEDDGGKEAEVNFDEEYQRITVKIYPCFWGESLADQRKALLHELCHSITLPSKVLFWDFIDGKATTKDHANDVNERATSQIENILDGLLRGRFKYAKRAYSEYIKKTKKKK